MCYFLFRATISAVSCLVVPAIIVLTYLLLCALKLSDNDDDDADDIDDDYDDDENAEVLRWSLCFAELLVLYVLQRRQQQKQQQQNQLRQRLLVL